MPNFSKKVCFLNKFEAIAKQVFEEVKKLLVEKDNKIERDRKVLKFFLC